MHPEYALSGWRPAGQYAVATISGVLLIALPDAEAKNGPVTPDELPLPILQLSVVVVVFVLQLRVSFVQVHWLPDSVVVPISGTAGGFGSPE